MNTEQILEALNSYRGDNIWQDVIYSLNTDEDAISAADPTFRSDVVVLTSGAAFHFDGARGEWVEGLS